MTLGEFNDRARASQRARTLNQIRVKMARLGFCELREPAKVSTGRNRAGSVGHPAGDERRAVRRQMPARKFEVEASAAAVKLAAVQRPGGAPLGSSWLAMSKGRLAWHTNCAGGRAKNRRRRRPAGLLTDRSRSFALGACLRVSSCSLALFWHKTGRLYGAYFWQARATRAIAWHWPAELAAVLPPRSCASRAEPRLMQKEARERRRLGGELKDE